MAAIPATVTAQQSTIQPTNITLTTSAADPSVTAEELVVHCMRVREEFFNLRTTFGSAVADRENTLIKHKATLTGKVSGKNPVATLKEMYRNDLEGITRLLAANKGHSSFQVAAGQIKKDIMADLTLLDLYKETFPPPRAAAAVEQAAPAPASDPVPLSEASAAPAQLPQDPAGSATVVAAPQADPVAPVVAQAAAITAAPAPGPAPAITVAPAAEQADTSTSTAATEVVLAANQTAVDSPQATPAAAAAVPNSAGLAAAPTLGGGRLAVAVGGIAGHRPSLQSRLSLNADSQSLSAATLAEQADAARQAELRQELSHAEEKLVELEATATAESSASARQIEQYWQKIEEVRKAKDEEIAKLRDQIDAAKRANEQRQLAEARSSYQWRSRAESIKRDLEEMARKSQLVEQYRLMQAQFAMMASTAANNGVDFARLMARRGSNTTMATLESSILLPTPQASRAPSPVGQRPPRSQTPPSG